MRGLARQPDATQDRVRSLDVGGVPGDSPDAQMLRDRMNIAGQRWPSSEPMPDGVVGLSKAVEDYYETGENPRQRIL